MKERGMTFGPASVRAMLAGTKTQTRRVAKSVIHAPLAVGDRVWVKEAWTIDPNSMGIDLPDRKEYVGYRADDANGHWGWHNPMFMPRWASRLWLDVTDVRLQRVQEISEADAVAEGAPEWSGLPQYGPDCYRSWYRTGWDSINAKRGFPWESNPWVWVVTFKRVA